MRIAWATDIHLDHTRGNPTAQVGFMASVVEQKPDLLVLTGDIGVADSLEQWLKFIWEATKVPTCFVLGNHDFWGSSFADVRAQMRRLSLSCAAEVDLDGPRAGQFSRYSYLQGAGPKRLAEGLYLIGEDSWYGMHEDFEKIDCLMNDWRFIGDFALLEWERQPVKLQMKCQELEGYAKQSIALQLEACFDTWHAREVILATHVPPFTEASLYRGQAGSRNVSLFSAPCVGAELLRIMERYPDRKLTVLAGHSHDHCDYQPLPNLTVHVGAAEYGNPKPQQLLVR